ncbi:MAG: hypothetical protein AAGL66_12960 [Pseudomonadota bacterium]
MFRNRQVITAMLVAPWLAVLAWFAAGALVGERPQPAQRGQSYPLVEKSSCRYPSGVCDLENRSLRLTLRAGDGAEVTLKLDSSHALDQVLMTVAEADSDVAPRHMEAEDEFGRIWYLPLSRLPDAGMRIRLAASRSGSVFFADASTAFLQGARQKR